MRTSLMESIASRLRGEAANVLADLDAYTSSVRPGMRLAAVMALQERPATGHASWLAARVCEERPFVGYHAALALRAIARASEPSELESLRELLDMTRSGEAALSPDGNRRRMLESALAAVDGRLRGTASP